MRILKVKDWLLGRRDEILMEIIYSIPSLKELYYDLYLHDVDAKGEIFNLLKEAKENGFLPNILQDLSGDIKLVNKICKIC